MFFVIDTMIANRNHSLDDEDVAYFGHVRACVGPDWARRRRIEALEEADSPSDAERKELEGLEVDDASRGFCWDEFLDRGVRCIANWCIANPELIDRDGRPVREGKLRDVRDALEPRRSASLGE